MLEPTQEDLVVVELTPEANVSYAIPEVPSPPPAVGVSEVVSEVGRAVRGLSLREWGPLGACGVLVLLQAWGGGSATLQSQALHSLGALLSLIPANLALRTNLRSPLHTPTKEYSYGLQRVTSVGGFSGGVFAAFWGLFRLFEALEHLLLPHPLSLSSFALPVGLLGPLFWGVRLLLDPSTHLWDVGVSLGGLLALLLAAGGYEVVDWVGAVGVLVGTLLRLLPALQATARLLLQGTPEGVTEGLEKVIHEINTLDGVLECRQRHFWALSPAPEGLVGSLKIRVRSEATLDERAAIRTAVQRLLRPYISPSLLTVQLESDRWDLPHS